MKKMQSGFTLIELVMVIVILGILAASALPKFADLSGSAEQAAARGIAGAINGADAVNIATCAADSASCVDTDGANLCTKAGLAACGTPVTTIAQCTAAATSITQNMSLGSMFIVYNAGVCYVSEQTPYNAGAANNERFDVSAADNAVN
jgi:prepilin-type N-terminal cleavage/methylation domain-containing protein